MLRVAGAQMNPRVGDIAGNAALIGEAMDAAEAAGADVLLLPELALSGYPPEDLVLRDGFVTEGLEALEEIAARSGRVTTVLGFVDRAGPHRRPDSLGRGVANAAALVRGGSILGSYHKILLPNYGVFDEARYFAPGSEPGATWDVAGIPVGVSICEDIWDADGPHTDQAGAGARALLNINGSPYHRHKGVERAELLAGAARRAGVPVVYLNMVGGQDELVFDGESMVFDGAGDLLYRAPQFDDEFFVIDLPVAGDRTAPGPAGSLRPLRTGERLGEDEEVYRALRTGLRDYFHKNGFREAVIGLSGGIDSALTCALAVDALGPEAVHGISMPSRYSSTGSVEDSRELARRLGCRFDVVGIDGIFSGYLEALDPIFAGTESGVAEENLQARIRGAVLMALSNKFGGLVVATGNKSEMAVGYATLYGDMAGGFAVLKDVYKTLVYRLAEWRNRDGEVIPRAIIDKPPSAELRPDQLDTDSLPEYPVLDEVLYRYIEAGRGRRQDRRRRLFRGAGAEGGAHGRSQRVQAQAVGPRGQDHTQGLREGSPAAHHEWEHLMGTGDGFDGVIVDGELVPSAAAAVSVYDIGLIRGYGCFEVIRAYDGRLFRLEGHLDRLESSADLMRIPLPPREELAAWITDRATAAGDCIVRALVTGGVGTLPGERSRAVVYAEPAPPSGGAIRVMPLDAPWHADEGFYRLTGAKTLSYAPNMASTFDAMAAGFDDALLLARSGYVLEGPTFGVGWVTGGRVETPTLELGILESITRSVMFRVAAELGVAVDEGRYGLDRLLEADEIFAMSTTKDIMSVVAVGDAGFRQGPVTAALAEGFEALVARELATA